MPTTSSRFRHIAVAFMLAIVAVACGGGGSTNHANPSAAPTTTINDTPAVLSAAELQRLVVEPPAPFEILPDAQLKTGLMEPGNPQSGEIAVGFAQEPQLTAAGLQRGWEKAFRTPDSAIVDDYVFEFRTAEGADSMARLFQSSPQTGFQRADVPGVPGALEYIGTSPGGLTALATAAAHGRFLFGLNVGGPPGAYPYRQLLESMAKQQLAALP